MSLKVCAIHSSRKFCDFSTEISANETVTVIRVKILVLDENRIGDVGRRTFAHLSALQQLWLNNNRVVGVPTGLPQSLQRLMLDSNHIANVTGSSFAALAQLNTLTLMQNNITEIDVAAFRPLSQLTHLDLSANRIDRLPPGLFESNAALKTLLLSRNPLRYITGGSFDGLKRLQTLSLSFIRTQPCVDNTAFASLGSLVDLQLDNSPWLAARLVASPQLIRALTGLRHVSLQRTDLAHLRAAVVTPLFSEVESVRLSGSGWVCDTELRWLRDWLMTSSSTAAGDRQLNRCAEPASLSRRLVVSLADSEFATTTRPRTGSSKLSTENGTDADCDKSPPTTTPDTTTHVLLWTRDNNSTSGWAVTSLSRRGGKLANSDDTGLIQIILIVFTLIVTVALSAIIIAVIVRLANCRHDDVTSGLKISADHVTGSRVSVSHCPPSENAIADGRRSRTSSFGRAGGGRATDCRCQTGSRKPAHDNPTDRLVTKAEVELSLTDECASRFSDDQRRVYTWEDT